MNEFAGFKKVIDEFELAEHTIIFDDRNNEIYYTQESFSDLYGTTVQNISQHIKKVYQSKELSKNETEVNLNCSTKTLIIQNESKNNKRGRKTVFYKHSMFNALGFRIQSEKAIQFRIKINELLERLRKGEVKLVSADKKFNIMALLPNTPHREKINQRMLREGKDKNEVEIRCFNVKLSMALKDLLIEVGHGGSTPYVRRKIGETIRRMPQEEYDKIHGITDPSKRRDHGDINEWIMTQLLDKMIFEMVSDNPNLCKETLHKYVKDVCKRGLGIWALIITDEKVYTHITTNQSSLFDYEKKIVKKLGLEI